MQPRIESLLSARLFMAPQAVGDRIYFISNLSGHMSLYAMNAGGSVPEPLVPPDVVLQNPILMEGDSYCVFPKLGKILLMLDDNGDENYQPMLLPLDGGVPEPAFDDHFANYRVHLDGHPADNIAYFIAESRSEQMLEAYRANLETGELVKLGESPWGSYPNGNNDDHTKVVLVDSYTVGDHALYLWQEGEGERTLLYGVPLEAREPGQAVPPNAIYDAQFVDDDRALLFVHALTDDTGSLGVLSLADPAEVQPVTVSGTAHTGAGEMEHLEHLHGDRYALSYNIDGVSWLYEGTYDHASRELRLDTVIVGEGELANGTLQAARYDKAGDRWALAFSTATSPMQIYTVEGDDRHVCRHTAERLLGIPESMLSAGEDASYTSFDGTRISARLYLPADALGFEGPRPLVYYVHGGPQSQERPDFAWFSMPLIQLLTLKGFAVFVPNVRGSTGYGLSYTKQVDRDWGGKDRLDHVHAMTEVLAQDERVDVSRAGVVGRSYGGYMTLTLAGRHPELWSAAVDMFGPYDLFSFMDRIPETWKPYFKIAIGDPETEGDFLIERSPKTYLHQLACPMLVIQGRNDPRVVEQESRDLVENLQAQGKDVELLVFGNEGHDILKYENRVRGYNAIVDFFVEHLRPEA